MKKLGLNQFSNFFLSWLTEVHQHFTASLTDVIQNREQIPSWLTEGTTYLSPETEVTNNP